MAELQDAPWATGGESSLPDAPWAPPAEKKEPPARGLSSYLPEAISDIPGEMYRSTAEALASTRDLNLPKGWGGQRDTLNEGALESIGKTGQGLLAAASVPFAPIVGAARSLVGHTYSSADQAIRQQLVDKYGEEHVRAAEKKFGVPEGGLTYEEAKHGADTALAGMMPARGGLRAPALPPAAPPPPPLGPNGPLGVTLSEGQLTRDLPAIRSEQAALRGQMGPDAERAAKAFYDQQGAEINAAREVVGDTVAGPGPRFDTPSEAAAEINADILRRAVRGRQMRDMAETDAAQEAAAARGMAEDQGRAISDAVAEGHLPIEGPREAGELTGQAVRETAARDRANYQRLYDEALGREGQFHAGAFEGIGNRIQGRLSLGDNPVIIDDVTTPIASRAIRDLDNISNLRIQNRADPFGDPNPENIVAVDLRGVDQARKRLVAFYRGARSSNNAADARAAGRLIDEFDNQVEAAISNGLFTGDPGTLQALREARAAYSRYARTYRPQQAGDDVGNAMRRIVDRQATPEEIANMIIGSGRIGNAGLPVRIADRLEAVLGRDSDTWSAIRQGIWQKASQVRNAAGEIDPLRSATGMLDLANSSLGRRMFSPQELRAMRSHAEGIRTLEDTIQTLPATQRAESASAIYQRAFGGDDLGGSQGAAFRRIVDGTATPEETAQAIFSAISSGNPGNVSRLIGAIEDIVGPRSQTMSAIRQGAWQRLVEPVGGADPDGPQKVFKVLNEFLNGRGRSIAERLYTPAERDLMQQFADLQKSLIIPPSGVNRSETSTFVVKHLRALGSKIGVVIGGALGRVLLPGLPPLVSEGLGASAAAGVAKLADKLQARQIAKQMPIVADAVRKYQRAVARAQRQVSTPAVAVASANLARALQPLGIKLQDIGLLQGPVPGRAEEKKNQP